MKQENLNELRNIYLGLVTGGEGPEVLNEGFGPFLSQAEKDDINRKMKQGRAQQPVKAPKEPSSGTQLQKALKEPAAGYDSNKGTTRLGNERRGYIPQILAPLTIDGKKTMGAMEPGKPNTWAVTPPNPARTKRYNALRDARRFETEKDRLKKVGNKTETEAQVDARVAALNAKKEPPAPVTQRPAAGTPTTAPRPAASGPVLSKLDGVEGTGVGANFNKKAFTDTERTRYSSVAAQNAARTSAASAVPPTKPVASTAPTASTAGGTKFERRTPTSAELGAAQASRAAGGSEEDAIKAGVGVSKPATPASNPVKADVPGFVLGGNRINNKKPTTPPPVTQKNSYQWPSIKTVRDIADAYTDIYEKHNDGDLANNYPPYDKVTRGDVIAGATGNDEMGRKKKKKPSNKKRINPYLKAINSDFEMWVDGLLNEGYDLSNYTWNEVYEIYENATVLTEEEYGIYNLVLEHLLSNGYAETEHDANIIIENMSDKWVDVIIDEEREPGVKEYKGTPPSQVLRNKEAQKQRRKPPVPGGYGTKEPPAEAKQIPDKKGLKFLRKNPYDPNSRPFGKFDPERITASDYMGQVSKPPERPTRRQKFSVVPIEPSK